MPRSMALLVDEQVRRWQTEREARRTRPDGPFVPANVVTLSTPLGTRGAEVARHVGSLLGVPVYDREIVDHIAQTSRVRTETVETLDEKAQNRMDEYLLALFRERNFDQGDYVRALTRTVTALWGHGPCVLVGRGANRIVYPKNAVSVRLVATMAQRVKRFSKLREMGEQEARRLLSRSDAERESFVKRSFGTDIDDPVYYDLVINLTGLSPEDAARVIATAYRRKFGLEARPSR